MSDNKKYYYMRLKADFFEADEMILLESMPDGYLYQNILLKLYLRSLKDEGLLMYRGTIPYTPEVLARVTRVEVGTMKEALRVFEELGLIEVLSTGEIYMLDIQLLIGRSSTEADRQRKYQHTIAQRKAGNSEDVRNLTKARKKSTPEIEIEKEIEIEIDERRSDEIVDNSSNTELNSSKISVIINKAISDNGLDFIYATTQRQQLVEYVTKDGMDVKVVVNAIQITKAANKPAFNYTDAILKNQLTQGLLTIDAVRAHEQQRNNAKGTANSSNEPAYKSPEWFDQQTPEDILSYFNK